MADGENEADANPDDFFSQFAAEDPFRQAANPASGEAYLKSVETDPAVIRQQEVIRRRATDMLREGIRPIRQLPPGNPPEPGSQS